MGPPPVQFQRGPLPCDKIALYDWRNDVGWRRARSLPTPRFRGALANGDGSNTTGSTTRRTNIRNWWQPVRTGRMVRISGFAKKWELRQEPSIINRRCSNTNK